MVNSAQTEVNSAPRISWAELTKVNSALYRFHTQSQFGPDWLLDCCATLIHAWTHAVPRWPVSWPILVDPLEVWPTESRPIWTLTERKVDRIETQFDPWNVDPWKVDPWNEKLTHGTESWPIVNSCKKNQVHILTKSLPYILQCLCLTKRGWTTFHP